MNKKVMKKMMSILIALFIICALMPQLTVTTHADEIASGTNGTTSWVLDDSGLLTISGEGAMDSSTPWLEYKELINSVVIEEGITDITGSAFRDCAFLTEISIPDSVSFIKWEAFFGCSNLKEISIPSSITCIEYNTFYGCKNLIEVLIPSGVTKIGNWAFFGCNKLTEIAIPDGVTSIGELAFNECSSLTKINIPNGVKRIENSVFSGCKSLSEINIPDGILSIGEYAFYNCSSLSQIIIPDSVKSIGQYAFASCTNLSTFTIPDTISNIGNGMFEGCSSLKEIIIPDCVTSIGDSAFNGCTNLTSINIPDGVTDIGNWTFSNCSSLTEITIPERVASIGEYAFSGCRSLTEITIPERVTSIGEYAFSGCRSLTELTIPGNVTSVGNSAFSDCTSLASINIPDSVTDIGNWTFSNCSSLTEITIPERVTSIGEYAFSGCRSLMKITIPDSVTSIGTCAFYNCSRLKEITIPNSVISIGESTFSACYNLKYVFYLGSESEWNAITIGINNECLTRLPIHYSPDHTWTDWTITTEPTCMSKGVSSRTCTVCEKEEIESIPAVDHDLITEVIDPTCTEQGYTHIYCKFDCGNEEYKDYVEALGHDWGEWSVTEAATCEDAGEEIRVCLRDESHVETRSIQALGHEWDEGIITREATCTEEGIMTYTCKHDPSHTYTETIPVIAHTPGESVIENEIASSCYAEGSYDEVVYCSVCHTELSRVNKPISKLDHTPEVIPAVSPTCTDTGLTEGSRCLICGEILKAQEVVPALGHDYVGMVVKDATCTEKGMILYTCTRDSSHISVEWIPAIGHQYGAPSYVWSDDNSSVTATSVCEHDATHVVTETAGTTSEVTVEAACETAGNIRYIASFTGELFSEQIKDIEISALGHTLTKVEAVPATYESEGNIEYWVCSECGKYFADEEGTEEISLEDTVVPKLEYIDISNATVVFTNVVTRTSGTFWVSYDGAEKNPGVKVTCEGKELVEGTDYTVSYSNNTIVGTATVTVTGQGGYTGTVSKYFLITFKDVPMTHSFQKAVYWAVGEGIAAGYSGNKVGTFGVSDDITRGQVVMFLWRAADKPEAKDLTTQSFTDVKKSSAFYKAIQWAVEEGIVGGYKDGTFRPSDNCTRGQIAMFLWRYDGKKDPAGNTQTFSDVPTSSNFYKAIQWAAEQGITAGYKDGTFGVNKSCTRGHCVTFLYRLIAK